MRVVLVSTYEMGRQPFGLASPAAWLRRAGHEVVPVDVSREPLRPDILAAADMVAVHLPMHTATRLALPLIERVRNARPDAHLCCYGLYAPLNEALLRSMGAATVLGGEFEADLVAVANAVAAGRRPPTGPGSPGEVPRLEFIVPDRAGLPPPGDYASLVLDPTTGATATTGYTEASRGCKHRCRHCPVVPVYDGRFRIVPLEVVMADVEAQVAAGARHITFGDPDFFNGVRHAMAVADAMADRVPGVTYDVTIKIEHLLAQRRHLERLRRTGCVLVTSAVESVDDRVLTRLDKGHTRADFEAAVSACRAAGLALTPTFVPFTPWTDADGYCDLLDAVEGLDLVDQVAPVQLAIRLLIPDGSRLLELREVSELVEPFDRATLTHPWRHADPEVDELQREVMALVGRHQRRPRHEVFEAIAAVAYGRTGRPRAGRAPETAPARARATVPYLDEPWYC